MGHKKNRYMGICDVRHDILIFFSINCSSRCFPKRKQPLWKACPTQLLQDELVQNFLRQARAAVKWACSVMMSTRLEGRILMGSRSWLGSEWCHSSDISTRPCETPSPLPFLCPAVSGYTDADGFVFFNRTVSEWVSEGNQQEKTRTRSPERPNSSKRNRQPGSDSVRTNGRGFDSFSRVGRVWLTHLLVLLKKSTPEHSKSQHFWLLRLLRVK